MVALTPTPVQAQEAELAQTVAEETASEDPFAVLADIDSEPDITLVAAPDSEAIPAFSSSASLPGRGYANAPDSPVEGEAATPLVNAPEVTAPAPRFASLFASAKREIPEGSSLNALIRPAVDTLAQTHSGQTPDDELPDLPPTEASEPEPEVSEPEPEVSEPAPEASEPEPEVSEPAADGDPSPDTLETEDVFDNQPASAEGTAPEEDALSPEELPREDLLADPNPLSLPTLIEEVEIDETSVITLEEAIELAYYNNQDLQAAILDLEAAEAALDEAEAARLPTVDAASDLTFQEDQGTIFEEGEGIDTTLGASLQVDYDLFTSGFRSSSIRTAEAQVRLNELEVEVRQEELRLITANLYYDIQEATEDIRINQAFLGEAAQNLRDNQLRQREGIGTRFDVLQAEVQFANARQALIQAQSQQRIAQRDLARQLNLPSTRDVQATQVAKAEEWPLTLEESILLAFQNRAELEQQLEQREIGLQQSIAARAAIRPQVSLFANYSLSVTFDDGNDIADLYSFGAQLSWRLYDGGAARASARQQEIAAEVAEEGFGEIEDQIRFEVEEAYFNLQANAENIDTAQVAVTQAQEALRLANLREDAGVGTQLEVLENQSDLVDAEGNLVDALLGYNRALAALQRAVSNLKATL
ncbi:MAG: TolC family protein [Cyanobacteria bacterium P01_F01_bin.4]